MSMIVLFSEVANLKVEKIFVFGTEVTIGNPALVSTTLWVLLVYWLIRYYQYFHELGDKGCLSSLKSKRKQLVEKLAFRKLFKDPAFIKSLQKKDSTLKVFPRSLGFFEDRLFFMSGRAEFVISQDSKNADVIETKGVEVKGWQLVVPTLLSMLHTLFRTRYLSEYILPFVLFTLPWYFSYPSNQAWLMSLLRP